MEPSQQIVTPEERVLLVVPGHSEALTRPFSELRGTQHREIAPMQSGASSRCNVGHQSRTSRGGLTYSGGPGLPSAWAFRFADLIGRSIFLEVGWV